MQQGIFIQDLSKGFMPGRLALKPFSAQLKPGKITGIVGPDGAGKTTLLRLMATILKPDSGTITINGFNTQTDQLDLYSRIGYMPQRFGLYEQLSVLENLKLYADLRGVPPAEIHSTIERFLDFSKLGPFRDRFAGKLSGGMKQKLGLACALLKNPEVLLLDEPSVGVDPISRRELWAIVKNLATEGTTVLWSTSYLDEAEKCEEILFLNNGDLLYSGLPSTITQRVDGRVFQTIDSPKDKRDFLQRCLKNEAAVDASIQGDYVKVVLTEGYKIADLKEDIQWSSISPNFEDGFIDFLGAEKVRTSKIAEAVDFIPKSSDYVIQAKELKKVFGDFKAVDGVSFNIAPGQIFGFLGPNGAGKSTTFKMLCGLLKPTSGEAEVLGYNMREASSLARQKIGYMGQKFALYAELSVLKNLAYFSGLYGLSGAKQKKEIDEMIEIFSLEKFLNVPTAALSLGYKQRISMACSLMHRPQILFLDEPTSGVDPLTRREFWLHINSLAQKGITIMVTTHFMEEAEYCDQICLIYRGNIIAQGTPDALKKLGQTAEVINPTLEDAFIHLVLAYDKKLEEQNNG